VSILEAVIGCSDNVEKDLPIDLHRNELDAKVQELYVKNSDLAKREVQEQEYKILMLASDTDSGNRRYYRIAETKEGSLAVLEMIPGYKISAPKRYYLSEKPLLDTVIRGAKCVSSEFDLVNFKSVLSHNNFNFPSFFHTISPVDGSKPSVLFTFPGEALIETVKVAWQKGCISYSQIISSSKTGILNDAICLNKEMQAERLIQAFSEIPCFMTRDFFEELIAHKVDRNLVKSIGAKLDEKPAIYGLWLELVERLPLSEEFRKKFAELSSKDQKILYEAAFVYNNPFLYEPATNPIAPKEYTRNVMWINSVKMPIEQELLFEGGCHYPNKEFHSESIAHITTLAKRHPGSVVNVWIDSSMAHKKAIQRAQAAIQEALEGEDHAEVRFRDVRALPDVKEHEEVFSERIPVYFRVDLLRAIAADYVLLHEDPKFFVYGDMDMDPVLENGLFDKRTVEYLEDVGFVLTKGWGVNGFENGFQIFSKTNKQFLASHREVIIEQGIRLAKNAIELAGEGKVVLKSEKIFDSYPSMILDFFNADGRYGRLLDKDFSIWSQGKRLRFKDIIPTKPVKIPRSHFGFGRT
jgi:hypothetical protein